MDTDTSVIPDSGATVASRSTTMGGGSVRNAAKKVKEVLFEVASKLLNVSPDEIEAADGKMYVRDEPGRSVDFKDVAKAGYSEGKLMAALGWYHAPKVTWDEETGQGKAYFTYVYGCQAVEVEVDCDTGKVKVLKVAAAHDVGRAINPATLKGQIYGGVAMGMGYGLLEEVEPKKGIANRNFDRPLLPHLWMCRK